MGHGALQPVRDLVSHPVTKLRGKGRSSLTDQISFHDAREE